VIFWVEKESTSSVTSLRGINQIKFNKNFLSIRHADSGTSILNQTHFDGAQWVTAQIKETVGFPFVTALKMWTTENA
jgi:hypothetical protein